MKYLVTFHDETCLCIDEAMFDADTPDVDMTDRLYISFKKDGHAFIYWYGRDFRKSDLWWIMSKR